jgi:hypothetical protein
MGNGNGIISFDTVGKLFCIYWGYRAVKFAIRMLDENQDLREHNKEMEEELEAARKAAKSTAV